MSDKLPTERAGLLLDPWTRTDSDAPQGVVLTCTVCGSLMLERAKDIHTSWHNVLANAINEAVGEPRLRYYREE